VPLSLQEKYNLVRWHESQRGFYEVFYLKWSDPSQGIAAWLRYTLLAPRSKNRDPEVSVWATFFDAKDPGKNCALKKTYSIREARIEKEIFYLSGGPSAIFDQGARGELTDGNKRFTWELKFQEKSLALRYLPHPFYSLPFPKTKFLVPRLSTRISGEFVVNDRKFLLNNVPAHQGHLWGKEHATSWLWSNGNTFIEDPNFCLDALSAQVMVGGRLSPPLTLLFFYWEGRLYRFNSPRQWFLNRSRHELDRWHFEAGTSDLRFVGELTTSPEEMVAVRYEDPTGSERFSHHTETADLKIQILKEEKSGWKSIKTLTASKSVAFEAVQPKLDSRVKLLIP
jgi:hypothetical protein